MFIFFSLSICWPVSSQLQWVNWFATGMKVTIQGPDAVQSYVAFRVAVSRKKVFVIDRMTHQLSQWVSEPRQSSWKVKKIRL